MLSKTNILVLVCSTCISLLLAELFLQAVSPDQPFNHQQLYCRYDSLLGWEKIPNNQGLHETEEYQVVENINAAGLRGSTYPLEKDTNTYRIMILGDSFAEGYTVNFDAWFSKILEDSLNHNCANYQYQVINAGTGGYATDQELLYYQTEGVNYHPDETILLFCVNDLWYNIQKSYWRGEKPMYRLERDTLTLTNVPVPKPAERPGWVRLKEWLLLHSELVKRIKVLKDKIQYARDAQSIPEEYIGYQIELSTEVEYAWRVTEALLREAKSLAAANGSTLRVFYIPEKIEIYPQDWEGFQQTYQLDAAAFDLQQYRKRLQQICAALDIPWLDPTPAFVRAAAAQPDQRLYYQQDWHWNAAGNALVATLLADWIACE